MLYVRYTYIYIYIYTHMSIHIYIYTYQDKHIVTLPSPALADGDLGLLHPGLPLDVLYAGG